MGWSGKSNSGSVSSDKFPGYKPYQPALTLLHPCQKVVDATYGTWSDGSYGAEQTLVGQGAGGQTQPYPTYSPYIRYTGKAPFDSGANRQGQILTFPAGGKDLTDKCIAMWIYIAPGNTYLGGMNEDQAALDDSSWLNAGTTWLDLQIESASGYRQTPIAYNGVADYRPGWHFVAFHIKDSGSPYTAAMVDHSLDEAAVLDFKFQRYAKDATGTYPLINAYAEMYTFPKASQPYFIPVCEAGYKGAMTFANYLVSKGLKGSFALDPVFLQQGQTGADTNRLSWDDAATLVRQGHFIYLYPRHFSYSDTQYRSWNLTPHAQKFIKLNFCRTELGTKLKLDAVGQPEYRYIMAIPSNSWSLWDEENLMGKEIALVPGNASIRGNALLTTMHTFGHTCCLGAHDTRDACRLDLQKSMNPVVIENWHCNDANLAYNGQHESYYACGQLDTAIAQGYAVKTLKDLVNGNVS